MTRSPRDELNTKEDTPKKQKPSITNGPLGLLNPATFSIHTQDEAVAISTIEFFFVLFASSNLLGCLLQTIPTSSV